MRRQANAFLLLSVLSTAAFSQSVNEEKLLLPIIPGRVSGAFGSEWETKLILTNISARTIRVQGSIIPCQLQCPSIPTPVHLSAHATITRFPETYEYPENRGVFLRVEEGRLADLSGTLLTRDLSRENETWGTTIPLVAQNDLLDRFSLGVIPTGSQFRATLRLYDWDPSTEPALYVRIYRLDSPFPPFSDELLFELTPSFAVPRTESDQSWFPAFAEIPLWHDPRLANVGPIRIEVQALDGRQEYWGFVSVTHNETQHVTIIAP